MSLNESQVNALFDILTHYETYAEIRDFRQPGSLDHYGPPFTSQANTPSSYPALQSLVYRFLLNLPGLRDVPEEFWKVQVAVLIGALEDADLSESYDKGVLGSRKTLSTAVSALIEYPLRGTLSGFSQIHNSSATYDRHDAEELARAFRDCMSEVIYGDLLNHVVVETAKTDNLEDHDDVVKAFHEYILVNLASLMHYTLILSPKGQYLVKLIDNINKLIPYLVVRQTLKIGNVASMVNAMVKVGLAKMSVASFTNWVGLTAAKDEGMNLMQSIISTVLGWDVRDLESRASKIEKEKNGLTKDQLRALRGYRDRPREEHEALREHSRVQSVSIVISILQRASLSTELSEATHSIALDYLAIQLSVRDRKEIIRVLCRSTPDHLTTAVRSVIAAYDPVIRRLHNAVNLSDTVYDFEAFLKDLLKLSKVPSPGKDDETVVPSVGDFIRLLKKHQYSFHRFLHQCCKNDQELTAWYVEWLKKAALHFERHSHDSPAQSGAGDMTQDLTRLFDALPQEKQNNLKPILDAQSKYLDQMHAASISRLAGVIGSAPSQNPQIAKIVSKELSQAPPSEISPVGDPQLDQQTMSLLNSSKPPDTLPKSPSNPPRINSDPGPGAFLSRWQDLLDSTAITPLTTKGPVQTASSKPVVEASAADVDGTKTAESIEGAEKVKDLSAHVSQAMTRPDVGLVIEALGTDFRQTLAARSMAW